MPHVIVKLWPGQTEEQKARLADAITKSATDILHCGQESISVAMEEIRAKDWAVAVYKPDIQNGSARLYKTPGYGLKDL